MSGRVLRGLLAVFALVGVVGTAGAFRGVELPGPVGGWQGLYCKLTGGADCVLTGGITGTTAGFSGQVTSNNANVLTSVTQTVSAFIYVGLTWGAAVPAANTPAFVFTTGAASTLTRLMYAKPYGNSNGTGTATIDVTDTAGTSIMSINYDCTAITTFTLPTPTTGSVALAANTQYQIRVKTNCATNGQGGAQVVLTITTP